MSANSNSSSSGRLKFLEPNQRDTVVKLHKTKPVENSASLTKSISNGADTPKENPMLERIRQMLTQADPSKWERFGEPLNPSAKQSKAYEAWETVYCIDLPSGLLTFRCSQPTRSEYFGGGYTAIPVGPANYSIELRPRAWNPATLIDPYFRSVLEKDKNFQIIASGAVAQDVYSEITTIIASFSSEKQLEVSRQLEDLAANILERANESQASNWTRTTPKPGNVLFEGELDNIKVAVSEIINGDLTNYRLLVSKERITRKITDGKLAQALFELIDEKNKSAALEALNDVLEKAGF